MTDIERAGSALDRLAEEHVDVGLSVAIVQDGRIALLKQYGLANRETGEPVGPESLFPIGSVSKQFTAAAVLTLVEDGRLALDDPVARFFPDLTRAAEIPVRALLNHTSGYHDWYPLDFIDAKKLRPTTIQDSRREYGTMPLDFDPGAFYSYSNTGYLIAACIVEKLAGRPFFTFLRERILEPLGMSRTHDYLPEGPGVVARYGRFFEGPIERVPVEADGWLTGAGGLISTPEDLAKWDIALVSGKVMSEESWREMTSPTTLADGRVSGYGLGLTNGSRLGHRLLGHRGGVSGAVAENLLVQGPDPGDGGTWRREEGVMAIAWCSNMETAALWPIAGALVDELIPEEYRMESISLSFNASRQITVEGPSPEEVGASLFRSIASGSLEGARMTAECGEFLAEDRLSSHRARLRGLGEPLSVRVSAIGERSGMQVAELRFEFASVSHRALLGRLPDGTIAEFMVQD